MELAAGPTWINCPQCKTNVPSYDGFVTWCDQCNWNLRPQRPESPGRLEKLHESLGRRQSQAFFNEVMAGKWRKPGLTLSFVLALLIATPVYLLTLAFAALGIWLIVDVWPIFISIEFFGALFCLLLAWYLRPNFGKLPADVLPKSEYPTLYGLVDQIARTLNAPTIDGIVVDWQFGASTGRVGSRQKRILYLGLPFWSILNNQERVAVLAHELAHHVNADPTRSLFVGNAINTLVQWQRLLAPANTLQLYSIRRAGFVAYISEIFANMILRVLAIIPWLGVYGLRYLLMRDHQRAEYRADYLAATVSGTAAMLSLMDKTQLYRTFILLAQKVSLYHKDKDLFVELRKRTAEVPERELERIKRLSEVEMSRLDVTHPPTLYRINYLAANPQLGKPEIMAPAEFEQLERETAALQPTIQKQVVKAYHAGLIPR